MAPAVFVLTLVVLAAPVVAQRGATGQRAATLTGGAVHELRLVLAPEAEDALRAAPREWAETELWVDGVRLAERAGVKLKGAAGSFRDYDDRPALTLRLDKFDGEAQFHGLTKFHLNNSVQDESLLCEWIGSEVFRAAGQPATRVGHAFVSLNQRDLGLYVLKEGFDGAFLARWFEAPFGNLYDGGFCQDVDTELERDAGKGPKDHSDLAALADACRHDDLVTRWAAIERALDVPAFARFMALEQLLGHWDGYTGNSNNYRLYIAPDGRARFLPHGMDQLFGEPEASTLEMPWALVARSVMQRPEWRQLYRKELRTQLARVNDRTLTRAVAPVQTGLLAALRRRDRDAARALEDRQAELLDRIRARAKFLAEEVQAPEPKPLVFRPGVATRVTGWRPHVEVEDALVGSEEQQGARWLTIRAADGARCVASFRRGVLLERGRYRLAAQVRTRDVVPLVEDDAPPGGLRLVSSLAEAMPLTGSKALGLELEFDVEDTLRDVELGFELRALGGEVRVLEDFLTLTRVRQ